MDLYLDYESIALNREAIGREHLARAPINVRRAIGSIGLNTVAQEKQWSTGERSRSVEIRAHQVDAWTALSNHRDKGKNKALIHMATGLGKTTVVAGDIASFTEVRRSRGDKAPRVLFLAHQTELIRQGAERLSSLLPDMSISELSSANKQKGPHSADIVVATLQSMHNRLDDYAPDAFDYVVVDESHHSMASNFEQTIAHFKPEFRLGMTATPFRGDQKELSILYGETVFSKGLEDAIAEELLVTPDYRLQMDDVLDQIVDQKFNSMKELNEVLFSETRNEEVSRIINDAQTELIWPKIIVFCRDIAHAEETLHFHPEAKALHSDVSVTERAKIMDEFKNGELSKIITVDMFNEGIDVPEANMLVFLRSTASRTIFEQQLGRGLRYAPDKDKVIVLDFVGTGERLQDLYSMGQEIRQKRIEIDGGDSGLEPGSQDPFGEADRFIGQLGFQFTQHQIDVLQYIKQAKEELEDAPDGWMSLYAAANYLGIGRQILLDLCADFDIEPFRYRAVSGHGAQFISIEQVERFKELLPTIELASDDDIVMKAAGSRLGFAVQTLSNQCAKLGIEIKKLKSTSGQVGRFITLADLESIRLALPNYELARDSDVSMSQMMQVLGNSPELITAVCRGLDIEPTRKRTPSGKAIGVYITAAEFGRLKIELPPPEPAPSDYFSMVDTIELLSTNHRALRSAGTSLGIEAHRLRGPKGHVGLFFSAAEIERLDQMINQLEFATDDDVSLSDAIIRLNSSADRLLAELSTLGLEPVKKYGRYRVDGLFMRHDQFDQLEARLAESRSNRAAPTDVSRSAAQAILQCGKERLLKLSAELGIPPTIKTNTRDSEGLYFSQEEFARLQAVIEVEVVPSSDDVSLYGARESLRQSTAKIIKTAQILGIEIVEKRASSGNLSKYITRDEVEQIRRYHEQGS